MAKAQFQAIDCVEALMAKAAAIRAECDQAARAFSHLERELDTAVADLAREKMHLWDAAFDAVEDELRRTNA